MSDLMSLIRIVLFFCITLAVFISPSFAFLPNVLTDWTSEDYVPVARSEIAGTVLNGKLYIIGGFDKSGQSTSTING
jgi:hypothetical protein